MLLHFYNCELQIKVKTFKNKKVTFSDFYCLINTKFWITNEKMFIKKITFSDVYFFISTTNQKQKRRTEMQP